MIRKLQITFLALALLVVTSCRMGEVLSEADPKTEAEVDQNDTIRQAEDDL